MVVKRERVRLWSGEVCGSNLGPVKLYTVLPTARHRCDISSKEAALPGCNNEELDP